MECDGGKDMDHAEHVHTDHDVRVRVVSADVGPVVEQTGTKNEVGMWTVRGAVASDARCSPRKRSRSRRRRWHNSQGERVEEACREVTERGAVAHVTHRTHRLLLCRRLLTRPSLYRRSGRLRHRSRAV